MATVKRTRRRKNDSRRYKKKACPFCVEGKPAEHIDYKDVGILRKYMSDRGKIRARRVTGACEQCQRKLALAIKNAREMALLPYLSR